MIAPPKFHNDMTIHKLRVAADGGIDEIALDGDTVVAEADCATIDGGGIAINGETACFILDGDIVSTAHKRSAAHITCVPHKGTVCHILGNDDIPCAYGVHVRADAAYIA